MRQHRTRNLDVIGLRCHKSPGSGLALRAPRNDGARPSPRLVIASYYCVFATRGGAGWLMDWVASSIAMPSGVGMRKRDGTRRRLRTGGANVIAILRWAVRYLITGGSGI